MVARVQGDENAFAREADAYGFDHNSGAWVVCGDLPAAACFPLWQRGGAVLPSLGWPFIPSFFACVGCPPDAGIHLIGRVVLNVWRIMRKEVTLRIYSYENVVFHILHRRVAKRTPRELTAAFAAVPSRHRTLAYIIHRTETCVELLEALDLVGRTSGACVLWTDHWAGGDDEQSLTGDSPLHPTSKHVTGRILAGVRDRVLCRALARVTVPGGEYDVPPGQAPQLRHGLPGS